MRKIPKLMIIRHSLIKPMKSINQLSNQIQAQSHQLQIKMNRISLTVKQIKILQILQIQQSKQIHQQKPQQPAQQRPAYLVLQQKVGT